MTACCTTRPSPARPCPGCGRTGPVVGPAPVRAHRPASADGAWQHCPTPGCPVVFHLDGDTITEEQVVARVGTKAPDAPEPVCFCFAHTPAGLAADLAAHDGHSTIKAAIKAAVAEGHCACEHLNPGGGCCLAAVHRTLKSIAAPAATATA